MKIRAYLAALALLFAVAAPPVLATIDDNTPRVAYTASGGQTAFTYTFEILAATDLKVYKNSTLLTYSTDYTVSGVGAQSGGTVTLLSAASLNDTVVIYRDQAVSRTTDYQAGAKLNPDTLDLDIDRVVLGVQQVERDVARSIHIAPSDTRSASDMELPAPSVRASKYLAFDTDGDVTLTTGTAAATPSSLTSITDAGAYYTATNVEEALQEVIASNVVRPFATLALLKAATPRFDGEIVQVTCYYTCTAPDGGGGRFKWLAANTDTADNGITVAADAGGTGRWKRLYSGAVNVKGFGAKGDGSTDDTTALNAAFDASGISECTSGTYIVAASLTPPSNSTVILRPGCTLKGKASTAFVSTGLIALDGVTDVAIYGGGTLDGNKANNATGRVFGISILNASARIRINGITAQNMPGQDATGINGGDGIFISGTTGTPEDIVISDCTLLNNVRQGISVIRGSHIRIANSLIKGTSGSAPGAGIDLEGNSGADVVSHVTIIGNTFEDNYVGVAVSDTGDVAKVAITGNTFKNQRATTILAGGEHTLISGNFIESAPTVSGTIAVYVLGSDNTVTGNEVVGSANANERQGIVMAGSGGVCTGNKTRGMLRAGIQVGTTTLAADISRITVTGNELSNNEVNGTFGGALLVTGTGTNWPNNVLVSGNTVYDSRAGAAANYGIAFSTSFTAADLSTSRVAANNVTGFASDQYLGKPLAGSVVWDPASLNDGAGETSASITVTGAAVGDMVFVYPGVDVQAMQVYGYISATDTVNVRLQNESGGVVDLASSTWRVDVAKRWSN